MHFTTYDNNGNSYQWQVKGPQNYCNVGGNLRKPRKFRGYSVFSPDGVERIFEGSWQTTANALAVIIDNYGQSTVLARDVIPLHREQGET